MQLIPVVRWREPIRMLPAKTKRRNAREPARGPPVSLTCAGERHEARGGKNKKRAHFMSSPGDSDPTTAGAVSRPVTLLLSLAHALFSFLRSNDEHITTSASL